jgi:hypothetical protein
MCLPVKCDVGEVAVFPGGGVELNGEGARWYWGATFPKIGESSGDYIGDNGVTEKLCLLSGWFSRKKADVSDYPDYELSRLF